MRDKVYSFIEKHQLLFPGAMVVAGVSGGPDSLALLHFLNREKDRLNLTVIAAHVDHMFRGEESYEDLLFVEKFCGKLSIPFEGKRINVPEYQKKYNLGVQEAARQCRFAFFNEVMDTYHADFLALAHHGDDQIETMLMRQVRGGYGMSLAGMQPRRKLERGEVIRPFLSVTKSEIQHYCSENGLHPRIDPTNEKDTYARNRFRHHVLPFLKEENPRVHERYQHLSEAWTEDNAYLEKLARTELDSVLLQQKNNSTRISIKALSLLPLPLQRRVIHLILNYLYRSIPASLSSVHIEQLLNLLESEHPSGTLHFPESLFAVRSYDECYFTFRDEKREEYEYVLHVPEEVSLPDGSSISSFHTYDFPHGHQDENVFVCEADSVKLPLLVRNRRNGDRMSVYGMKGTKKLKDIFIDQKIPIEKRNRWPVVTDSEGTILWLPQLKKSAFAEMDRRKQEYIVIQYSSEATSSRRGRNNA